MLLQIYCLITILLFNSIIIIRIRYNFAIVYLSELKTFCNSDYRFYIKSSIREWRNTFLFYIYWYNSFCRKSTKGISLAEIDMSRFCETKFQNCTFNCSKSRNAKLPVECDCRRKKLPGTLRPSFPDLIRFSAKVAAKWSEKTERWKRSQISCRTGTLVRPFAECIAVKKSKKLHFQFQKCVA